MPLPAVGCQTCRARHIKCDGMRPTCLNCRKSGRHCAGWRAGSGSMLFLNENVYASTNTRRPRGGARWVPEFSADDLSAIEGDKRHQNRLTSPATGSDLPDHELLQQSLTRRPSGLENVSWIPPKLQYPLRDLAITYFAKFHFRLDQPTAEDLWSLTSSYFQPNSQLVPGTALELAFTALALVSYGKAHGVTAATLEGHQKYSQALRKIRNSIQDKAIALTDEMLIAVAIMATYENAISNFDENALLSYSFHHHTGAIVLLKYRQQHRRNRCLPNSIDHCMRRRMVKGSIYRAVPVDEWLKDGSLFGEFDHQLGLDRVLVDLAALRYKLWSTLFNEFSSFDSGIDSPAAYMEGLVNECLDLLHRLDVWKSELDSIHHLKIHQVERPSPRQDCAAFFFSTQVLQFHDDENASMWNRYHGVRLFINGILLKVVSFWQYRIGGDSQRFLAFESSARADIQLAANYICAGVPYAFNVTPDCEKGMETILHDVAPHQTNPFVWSFVILIGSQVISELQRQWIREKLILVSKLTGNGTLETIANMNLQYRICLRVVTEADTIEIPDRAASGRMKVAPV